MANVTIGSARHDEKGNLNGVAGDQLQTGAGNDFKGEVSMQAFYVHKYDWDGLRAKKIEHRHKIAERMVKASNNNNIGYSQAQREKILSDGIESSKKTNCDCSSLLREDVKEATGNDPGNFTTANGKKILMATGLFDEITVDKDSLMTGDILISKKKGHCAVVVLGKDPDEPSTKYYSQYTGKGTSLVSALAAVGEKDTSFKNRKKIAEANGIQGYIGSIAQNLNMISKLKKGELKKA